MNLLSNYACEDHFAILQREIILLHLLHLVFIYVDVVHRKILKE
jgi:hypothetical protein